MTALHRRSFLSLSGTLALAGAPAKTAPDTQVVHLTGDGVPLTPVEYTRLLARLTEERNVTPDTFSREGTLAEFEQRVATLLGKECAVFLPTGTMANHLAIRALANGRKVIVQHESHLYNDEGDCAQRLSGLNLVPLAPGKAAFTLNEVQEAVEYAEGGRVAAPVGVISIESPVRRKNGEVVAFDEMKRIAAFARKHGIALHLDGARLFLAAPYTGVTPAEYSTLYDTVYFSLYKYFNASFGGMLAGPRNLLENLYHTRRMFGGGLPHVWPQAVVAGHFLEGFGERYGKAVASSEAMLKSLAAHPGFEVRRVSPGTNIATVSLPVKDGAAYQARLRSAGIVVSAPKALAQGRVELTLQTNETILRRGPEDLAAALVRAADL